MNVQDIVYHGVRDQIRRVLGQMSPDELDRGMTAFEDGSSNWTHCFFARAIGGLDSGQAESKLMKHLKLDTPIPIRIVYCTFDGMGTTMTQKQLASFIESVRDESRPEEVLAVIRSIDYSRAAETPVNVTCG